MNSDPLAELWNSPANKPVADAGAKIAARFVAQWRARRRRQAWWLAWTVLSLAAATALALKAVLRGEPATWTLMPLLALPWLVALRFAREFFRDDGTRGAAGAGRPLRDVLHSARDANADERRRLRIVALLLAVMAPFLALAVRQLHVSGKASLDEAWSMALVFVLALSFGAAGVAWKLVRRLAPERRRIEMLLRDLDRPCAP